MARTSRSTDVPRDTDRSTDTLVPLALGGCSKEICDDIPIDPAVARNVLRPFTTPSAKACGFAATMRVRDGERRAATVGVRRTPNSEDPDAWVVGPVRCKSPNSCPVCSPAARRKAAERLKRMMAGWRGAGGVAHMLTLTVRHRRGHDLARLLNILRRAWKLFTNGAAWRRLQRYLELAGHTHTLEITRSGGTGWHPHLHALFLVPGGDPAHRSARARAEARRMIQRMWRDAVAQALEDAAVPAAEHAQFMPSLTRGATMDRVEGAGDYLVKMGLAKRASGGDAARTPSRSIWEIMWSAAAGDTDDKVLWHEYTRAIKGVQLLPNLQVLERLAEVARPVQPAQPEGELVAVLPGETFNEVVRAGATTEFTRMAARHGALGVAAVVAKVMLLVDTVDFQRPPRIVLELAARYRPRTGAGDPSPMIVWVVRVTPPAIPRARRIVLARRRARVSARAKRRTRIG